MLQQKKGENFYMKFKRECDLLFHKASQDLKMAEIAIDSNKIDLDLVLIPTVYQNLKITIMSQLIKT